MTYVVDTEATQRTSAQIARAARAEAFEDARLLRSSLWTALCDRVADAMADPDDPEAAAAQKRAERAYLDQSRHLAVMTIRYERHTGIRRATRSL